MANIKSLCVFCGSQDGLGTGYARLAREIGRIMAERKISVIYGGGSVGTMGHLARSALAAGGEVVGVIPTALDDSEIAFEGCTELHVVSNMHQRKKMMFDLADAVLVLPGGVGTLELMIEVITWRQMRMHEKPIILLNTGGFWKPLFLMFQQMVNQEFASKEISEMFSVVNEAEEIMPLLDAAEDPWLDSESDLI
jgi:uncharacterized protein (TIGR00730 family)